VCPTRKRALAIIAFAVAGALGCGPPGEDSGPAPASGSGVTAKPFVVFINDTLVVDRLGAPTPVPAAIGSTLSPETIESDTPDVVFVTPDGQLVGVRDGRATIRTIAGPAGSLAVLVRAAEALAIRPATLQLKPGQSAVFTLVDASGEAIPAAAATWATAAPEVAIVVEGQAEARQRGNAVVTATYGGRSAVARVVVASEAARVVAVRPESVRLRVGQPMTFQALSARGPVEARWSLSSSQVLDKAGDSTYVAVRPGRCRLCAESGGATVCTGVTVLR
jgi:regulator of extracellular matrix RemA (YlzA/DUF370 family)